MLQPGAFLPSAERYGLAARLDRWVIDHALDWLGRHPEHTERLRLCSLNLSGPSLADEEFLEYVKTRVDRLAFPAEKICFEITETAAIAELRNATRFIHALKDRGAVFALDDFGSGLSSFAYLKALPVDLLKIDGLFVRDMAKDSVDHAMVKAINDMGHAMGKQTIAECVESRAVLASLREIGIDFAQGYATGRPRPLEELGEAPQTLPSRFRQARR